MEMISDRPIFVIGVHRSGTTLMRFMLNSSPRIYLPPESDFIPRFFLRDPKAPLDERRVGSLLNTIFSKYRFVREWQGDPPNVEEFTSWMDSPTPTGFLQALYSTYARQYDAVRWGDKTPIYTSYVDLLHQIFPQAQFVHIIRDGRDVALSMLEKWGRRELHIDIYFSARNWVRRIRQAQKAGARLGPSLYYELRYEDLVQNPEKELEAVCRFLDEPYVPEMAQPHLLGRQHIAADAFHAPIRQPPNTKRVGRWREAMSGADQRLFQYIAGEMLAKSGYPVVELGPMSMGERARFAALGVKYGALQAGRRVVQALGLLPPI